MSPHTAQPSPARRHTHRAKVETKEKQVPLLAQPSPAQTGSQCSVGVAQHKEGWLVSDAALRASFRAGSPVLSSAPISIVPPVDACLEASLCLVALRAEADASVSYLLEWEQP